LAHAVHACMLRAGERGSAPCLTRRARAPPKPILQ